MKQFLSFRNASSRSVEYILAGAFLVISAVLLWVFILLRESRQMAGDTQRVIAETREILLLSAKIETEVLRLESAARGYIISGQDEFMNAIDVAEKVCFEKIAELQVLAGDNKRQSFTLAALSRLVKAKARVSKRLAEASKTGADRITPLVSVSGEGYRLTGSITAAIAEIQQLQERILRERVTANEYHQLRTTRLTIVLGVLICLIVLLSVIVSTRALRARRAAEEKQRDSSRYLRSVLDNIGDGVIVADSNRTVQLVNPAAERLGGKRFLTRVVPEGASGEPRKETLQVTGDLQETLVGPAIAGEAIDNLELRSGDSESGYTFIRASSRAINGVPGGAAVLVLHDFSEEHSYREKLLEANRELDAFCYSISHDLRAPLRSVSGFTQILLEDYGKKLDAEAMRICNVIVRGVEKMGRLIDDLLNFSRVGRHEILPATVDMKALFTAVAGREVQERGNSKAEMIIRDMPPAVADPELLRQALVNLVSNALKYSARKKDPVVEMGAAERDNETVYFIKDNGEGFDMRYYAKLFEVFQRLHSDREFEGTGVGLSIVKRIIERHGGRIWAEGVPGEGAVFYFTLGKLETGKTQEI